MNQSSPRWLCDEGWRDGSGVGNSGTSGAP
jgi:hypothetical protein